MTGVGLGSLVLSLFGTDASSDSSSLLAIANGSASTASGTDPTAALRTAEANSSKDIALTAAEPAVARDIKTFRNAVASATSPAQLLKNPTVLKVLLTANGLGDQAGYPALAAKALLSDPNSSTSLANTLTNQSWKTTAALYDFANKGLAVLQKPGVVDTIADGYAEATWRDGLDNATPGLSEALSFKERASSISSVDQILGDSTLRKVVTTALGIPVQIAFQTLGAQEKSITTRLDIGKFKDPKFVAAFTTRYLIAAQASDSTTSTATFSSLAVQAKGLVV